MALLSMNETTTYRWSFEEDVTNYSLERMAAIGVWRQKLSDCGVPKAKKLLDHAGLKVSHLFWAGGFTGSDGRTHRESIEDAAEAIRTSADLNCPTLVVYTGPRAGHTVKHSRRLVQAALAELIPLAQQSNITLAIEPMHAGCADQWTFLNTLDDTLSFLAEVANPRVKMVLDTYHLGQEPELVERIPAIVDQVAIVQLGDAKQPPDGEQNRCRLDDGVIPNRRIVAALKSAGYDGYYDIELLGEEFEAADYHVLLRHARETFDLIYSQ